MNFMNMNMIPILLHVMYKTMWIKAMLILVLNGRTMKMRITKNGGCLESMQPDWKELEDNLTFAEGVCCRMDDCSSVSEANPELWTNLKYIRIVYYGEDAEVYEQELKELFPDVEVHVGNR